MSMDRTLHIRLDDAADQALKELRALGINPAELIREALRQRAAAVRTLQSHSESARDGEKARTRLTPHALDSLMGDVDDEEAAGDTETWERFLTQQPKDALPIIQPWRDPEDGTC